MRFLRNAQARQGFRPPWPISGAARGGCVLLAILISLLLAPAAGFGASFGDTAVGVAIWGCLSGDCNPGVPGGEFPMDLPVSASGQNDLLDTALGDTVPPLARTTIRTMGGFSTNDFAEIVVDPVLPPSVRLFAAHAESDPTVMRETAAVAFFQDQLVIDDPARPVFSELRFSPILSVSGALHLDDSQVLSAFVEAGVTGVVLAGDGFGGIAYDTSLADGGYCSPPSPSAGPRDCSVEELFVPQPVTPFPVGVIGSGAVVGTAGGGQIFDERPFTFRVIVTAHVFGPLDASADLSATVSWVGLRVFESDGTTPIPNATITSASGIDWTQDSVPEPEMAIMLAAGVIALAALATSRAPSRRTWPQ